MPSKHLKTTATILGRARKLVWMKIPDLWPNTILTLPDEVLVHGTKTAEWVRVSVEPDSLYNTGVHFRAKVKVLGRAAS
jgi:hypothetical protein